MKTPETPFIEVGEADPDDPREPYVPPGMETEELFEVLALACGKVQSVSHTCPRGANRQS